MMTLTLPSIPLNTMLWPSTLIRKTFDRLDSTNRYGRENLSAHPFWVLAYAQTAGVGRQARVWSTETGNFAASYVAPTARPLNTIALHSFIAALALYDACIHLGVPARDLSLKWPNDVLLKGGKLAGILLETASKGATSPSHLLVGIGVNLVSVTEDITAANLAPRSLKEDAGLTVSPDDFLVVLANTYIAREAQFSRHGFAPLREDWLNACAHHDQDITARTAGETITGRFETLDLSGALILKEGEKRHTIHAGDIFFTPPQDKTQNKTSKGFTAPQSATRKKNPRKDSPCFSP